MITFSIIVPTYNSEPYVSECIESVLKQEPGDYEYEVIIIDDCSTDKTVELVRSFGHASQKVKMLSTERNSGPGIARNVGIKHAVSEWILFLDSDDLFEEDFLDKLAKFISTSAGNDCDAISFNRNDMESLSKGRPELLKDYLSLKMDGSVIFTAVKRSLFIDNTIHFSAGYHEDVDFLFKVYFYAKKIMCYPDVHYIKRDRPNSIVNTITENHIRGFFRAYQEIITFLQQKISLCEQYLVSFYTGLVGVVATRVRAIYTQKLDDCTALKIYITLDQQWRDVLSSLGSVFSPPPIETKYGFITKMFLETMATEPSHAISQTIQKKMDVLMKQSWSCQDLQLSLFCTPNEIRTCCKRFFVDGKMKGDVSLVREEEMKHHLPDNEIILKAKRDLYRRINCGEETECTGCPFLEFKGWQPIDSLDVSYLSLEYQTVCNMKCIYCDDKYYGGEHEKYDIQELIHNLVDSHSLDNIQTIVWGGGEPVIDNSFEPLIKALAAKFPELKQRVITNGIIYSEMIKTLLERDQLVITTSIDAGTPDTFVAIRKSKQFDRVFENLQKYAQSHAHNVTVKYIIMEGYNTAQHELMAFVEKCKECGLLGCNFQISCNFKAERIKPSDVIPVVILNGLLIEAGVKIVYVDDLLRQRMRGVAEGAEVIVSQELKALGLNEAAFAKSQEHKDVVLWGAGWQTKNMLDNTLFFRKTNVKYIVDDSLPSKVGQRFCGYEIKHPSELKNNSYPVLIAAVQGYPVIYDSFVRLGLEEERLIKGLVI